MRFRLLRILVPTAGMSLLLLLLGGVAAWYLDGLQRESSRFLHTNMAKVEAAEELVLISHDLCRHLEVYRSSHDETNLAEAKEAHKKANAWLTKAGKLANSGQEAEVVGRIARGYQALFEVFQSIADAVHRGEDPSSFLDRLHEIANQEILGPAKELVRLTRDAMDTASARNVVLADRMGMGLLLLGCCGAVAGLLAGYGIARGIYRSLAQLTVSVRDATGRLNEVVGPLTVSSGESFEELEATLQDMAGRVGEVVRQLQESQLAATRSQQLAAMGQLAAGLAHELRNPLTSMKMLVQAGDDGPETVQLDNQDLAVLREEIDRLERTIQVFLDYARPPTLEKRPIALRQIIAQTVEFLAPRARTYGVHVDVELPQHVVQVEADAGQIRQVLLNLLLNAFDVSAEGSTVLVKLACDHAGEDAVPTQKETSNGAWIRLEIADRGSGLPGELGDRIFEPFVSTKDSGTGLGLPICRRIVEEHGGELLAEDREGGGAVFVVRLPLSIGALPRENAGRETRDSGRL